MSARTQSSRVPCAPSRRTALSLTPRRFTRPRLTTEQLRVNLDPPAALLRFFSATYPTLHFEPSWLRDCYAYLVVSLLQRADFRTRLSSLYIQQQHFPEATPHQLIKKVEFQLLASSLSSSTVSAPSDDHQLPSHPFPLKPTVLFPTKKDRLLVQVVAVDEIALPALEMLEVLKNKREAVKRGEQPKREGVEIDEKEEEDLVGRTTYRRGTTKLRVSDGRREVDAVEWKRVNGLGLEELKLGCKVSLGWAAW